MITIYTELKNNEPATFLDTSYVLALLNTRDELHHQAQNFSGSNAPALEPIRDAPASLLLKNGEIT